uniref:Bifunctional adenosylcobalamin biosynthesis protein n=1 Tax=Candidatus Kentrum sp. DK TaxID=2126562 RepID=A0A450RYD0_9GAMM|nr:MAG: adenosylcobinamide kinase /adenosylcobinamide-phosphate guanylyltransferase [Candidatus Kentron sp. DK]
MAMICLITGGCRSGKSAHAQSLAEEIGQRRLFIATAPVLDEEMRQRVLRHREARRGAGWETWEEERGLAECLRRAGREKRHDVVLCDCLTLWVNNLLYAASQEGAALEEEEMAERTREVCAAARAFPGQVFFVTNEVGMGIVPGDAASRRFRDLAGRCNREVAKAADGVILMVSGIPVTIS